MLKKLVSLFFISAALASPAFAADWGWQHINLQSEQGAKIDIAYHTMCFTLSPGRAIYAPELWVEVNHPAIREGVTARAVFITKSRPSGEVMVTKEIDLTYRGGQLASGPYPYGYMNNFTNTRQEIAVVIDGEWQVDPMNGSHNFQFSLLDIIPNWYNRRCS